VVNPFIKEDIVLVKDYDRRSLDLRSFQTKLQHMKKYGFTPKKVPEMGK
jgi:hypothetical protein